MKISDHRVFFIAEEDFITPNQAQINESDSFHIKKVLRLKKADQIIAVTSQGKFSAHILRDDSSKLLIELDTCLESKQDPTKKITLLQSLPKLRKMDEIIEKSTEFGVFEIFPVMTLRSSMTLSSPVIQGKDERWKRIAMAASKQSRRCHLPVIHPPVSLSILIQDDSHFDQALKIVFWEQEQKTKLIQLLSLIQNHSHIVLCIGPEGGFAVSEIEELTQHGFKTCSLGQQILRTETAGPFAVGFIETISQ
jgi:16S rRNA (uracil1498-N3)-methyltransferase